MTRDLHAPLPPETPGDPPPPSLSWASMAFALAVTLAVFTLLNPIWLEQEVGAWDENVWWSYAPIPLLVALLLWREGKLGRGSLIVETMKLGLVKFFITFVIANTIWAVRGAPSSGGLQTPSPAVARGAGRFSPEQAPEPTPLSPDELGALSGVVLDGDGRPRAGVVVAIVDGMGARRFAASDQALTLVNDGRGFAPTPAVAQAWQPVRLVSGDGRLHTAVLADRANQLMLNHPVLAGGERSLMFRRAYGDVRLHCSVHADEAPSRVVVVAHPFAAVTGDDGAFAWEGVPAGAVGVRAWVPGEAAQAGAAPGEEAEAVVTVTVAPGAAQRVTLTLRR